ncbi:MAG: S41 family peptidase [Chitinophagaceae bacterium]
MQILKQRFLLAALAGMTLVTACQKEVGREEVVPPATTPPPAGTHDAVKDTVLAYSQDIYLWYKQIPSNFDAQSHADPGKIMTALRQYSMETGFTKPVDRWSFAIDRQSWDNASSGIAGDLGLSVFFRGENDLRVKSVEAQSPAGRAGVRRGWRVASINGNSNMTTANSDFIVENVFYSNSSSFTFVKPDNSTAVITLKAATYKEQPVMLDTVYNINNKKIGYFVFNSFLGDTTQVYNQFSRLFSRFASENVSDVVVDLRYNGGGYVSVQEKLANYLAPTAANGQLMMKQEYNDKYTRYNSTELYKKLGSLNLNRIFFIVSGSTASASELVINNLKPYMDVILLGPSNTYGKPVGYFAIPVGSWYIFPVSFRSTNQKGEGAYFDGLPVAHKVADGLDKDWGDVDESSLASAIRYITTGRFTLGIRSAQEEAQVRQSPAIIEGNKTLDKTNFKGAVDVRKLR